MERIIRERLYTTAMVATGITLAYSAASAGIGYLFGNPKTGLCIGMGLGMLNFPVLFALTMSKVRDIKESEACQRSSGKGIDSDFD